jgi:GH25 family lysozyme M1 (1,4-beta-N-acetylmuramidase)
MTAVSAAASVTQTDREAGNENTGDEVLIPATKLRGSPRKFTLQVGESRQVKLRMYPTASDDYIVPRVYNKRVAAATPDGLVTALAPGETIIRFETSTNQRLTVTVTVEAPDDDYRTKEIQLEDSYVKLKKGKSSQIYAFLYNKGKEAEFTYTSSNEKIAAVDKSGKVTAKGTGEAVIVVSSGDLTAQYYVSVYQTVYSGIDVSRWQEDIDWVKVAADGIDFAIIRASYGTGNTDSQFLKNVKGCENNNIKYGIYHYTYAETAAEAKTEAALFAALINDTNPDYPVVLDIEEDMYKSMSKKQVTEIIYSFCDELKETGITNIAIYSNSYFFMQYTQLDKLCADFDIWIASWGDAEKLDAYYDGKYSIWQYSSTGHVNGIKGEVDLNYSFKSY